ncbi:hypothetical protein JMM63_01290 [Rhodovulum sulfidophilum]|nr:hypothetical protein [Rhodovulum sulfidophilum]
MGVFARIFEGLAAEAPETPTIMIEVSLRTLCVRVSLHKYFKAYRTASSLRGKKGGAPLTAIGGSVAQIPWGIHLVNPEWYLGCMSTPPNLQDQELAGLQ